MVQVHVASLVRTGRLASTISFSGLLTCMVVVVVVVDSFVLFELQAALINQ